MTYRRNWKHGYRKEVQFSWSKIRPKFHKMETFNSMKLSIFSLQVKNVSWCYWIGASFSTSTCTCLYHFHFNLLDSLVVVFWQMLIKFQFSSYPPDWKLTHSVTNVLPPLGCGLQSSRLPSSPSTDTSSE